MIADLLVPAEGQALENASDQRLAGIQMFHAANREADLVSAT